MTGKGGSKDKSPAGGKKASPAAKKARPRSPKVDLPSSGLAEDILAAVEGGIEGDGDADSQGVTGPASGPERVFAFADSLETGEDKDEEPEEQPEIWVTFGLGAETFAFPVSRMQEVIRIDKITRVPHAPFPIRGITNLRGRVLPVVDLRVRLELPAIEVAGKSRILVVDSRGRTLGLLVDRVEKVVQLLPSGVEAPPDDVMTEQSEYLLGVYQLDGGLLILLDLDKVLLIREPVLPAAGIPGPGDRPENEVITESNEE